jgi:hypothetical protein
MTQSTRAIRGRGTLAAALAAGAPISAAPGETMTWTFEADAAGSPPTGFRFERTGGGPPGHWIVRAESDAPSGKNVLAKTDADRTDDRFPIAAADAPTLQNVALSVKCKPISGMVDQACGLFFRYRDAKN